MVIKAGQPGSVVVLTGATRGIGVAAAQRFAAAGAHVIINSRSGAGSTEALERLRSVAAGRVEHHLLDVSRADDLDRFVASVVADFGGIDVWVNNASPEVPVDFFEQLSPEDWRTTIEAKLFLVLGCIRAVLPVMKDAGGGSIVNVVSDAGRVGTAGESLVSAAYGAVIALSKSLAREFARYGVRVNNVSVSLVRDTPGYDWVFADDTRARIFRKIEQRMPLGVLDPDDVAQAITYLAGASRVTGQTLSVNSGLSFPS